MRLLAVLTLPLLLVACGDAPDEGEGALTDAEINAANPLANASLDLQGTGIVIPAQSGFEELAVPFGSGRIPTEATLGNVVGEAIDESDEPNDCGLTFTSYNGLQLSFRDDTFVGYWATAPYIPEATRAQFLADENIVMVEGSTVGEEFTIGDPATPTIAGLFTGTGDDATIQALWAGENCIAR